MDGRNCYYSYSIVRLIFCAATIIAAQCSNNSGLADNLSGSVGSELDASLRLNEPERIAIVRGSALTISNSDHITHHENMLGFRQDLRRQRLHTYGVDYSDIRGEAVWLHYTGYKVVAFTEFMPAEGVVITAAGGVGRLILNDFFDKSYGQAKTLPLGRLKVEYSPIPLTFFRVEVANDFSYLGWLNTEQSPVVMPANSVFVEAEHFTERKLQLRSNVKEIYLGDSNQQFIFDNLALQDVVGPPLVVSLGVGGGYTTFSNQTPGYWDPDYLANYGLRAVVSYDLSDNWHTEGRFNLGVHQDKSGRTGKESAAEMHVEYHAKSGQALRLIANLLDSEHGTWWRDDFNLVAEIPF